MFLHSSTTGGFKGYCESMENADYVPAALGFPGRIPEGAGAQHHGLSWTLFVCLLLKLHELPATQAA